MHDARFMGDLQAINNIEHIINCSLDWKRSLLVNDFFERTSGHQFHRDVKLIAQLACLVNER